MKGQEARGPEREGNSVPGGRSLVKVTWPAWSLLTLTSGFDQSNHQTRLFVKAGTLRNQVRTNVINAGPEEPVFN